jgi:hypothetical protein
MPEEAPAINRTYKLIVVPVFDREEGRVERFRRLNEAREAWLETAKELKVPYWLVPFLFKAVLCGQKGLPTASLSGLDALGGIQDMVLATGEGMAFDGGQLSPGIELLHTIRVDAIDAKIFPIMAEALRRVSEKTGLTIYLAGFGEIMRGSIRLKAGEAFLAPMGLAPSFKYWLDGIGEWDMEARGSGYEGFYSMNIGGVWDDLVPTAITSIESLTDYDIFGHYLNGTVNAHHALKLPFTYDTMEELARIGAYGGLGLDLRLTTFGRSALMLVAGLRDYGASPQEALLIASAAQSPESYRERVEARSRVSDACGGMLSMAWADGNCWGKTDALVAAGAHPEALRMANRKGAGTQKKGFGDLDLAEQRLSALFSVMDRGSSRDLGWMFPERGVQNISVGDKFGNLKIGDAQGWRSGWKMVLPGGPDGSFEKRLLPTFHAVAVGDKLVPIAPGVAYTTMEEWVSKHLAEGGCEFERRYNHLRLLVEEGFVSMR